MLKVFIQFYGCKNGPIGIFNGIDFLRSIVTLTRKRIKEHNELLMNWQTHLTEMERQEDRETERRCDEQKKK